MIVATAGHVDHGKTLLVKSLTGVDTDRLPEEKERGLTIDLGFAYRDLGDGMSLGFVDVPGHERFVRNMLAGVAGIDFALLVVAADDGPMPQTHEHLAILDFLAIKRGAVAISKIDRADSARVAAVGREVSDLLAETGLRDAPIFPLSAHTGEGVAALKSHLEAAVRDTAARSSKGNFRLAVDRIFTVTGAGVVATGSAFSGRVNTGDHLVLSPQGTRVRVRGIHAQNRKSETGVAGQRCALNIAGPDLRKADLRRGDWLVAPDAHAPTDRMDARLQVAAGETRSLKHWTPVHLHLGAADIGCRVAVLEDRAIPPGGDGLVQLVLDREVPAVRGDRFVLRDQSSRRTLAGGEIIDPFSPARGRAKPQRLTWIKSMETRAPEEALARLLEQSPGGLSLDQFRRAWNLTAVESAELWQRLPVTRIEGSTATWGLTPEHWRRMRDDIADGIATWHADNPETLGPSELQLARRMTYKASAEVLHAAAAHLVLEGIIRRQGTLLHMPDHRPAASTADMETWAAVEPLLLEGGLRPPRVRELAEALDIKLKMLERFLARAEHLGWLHKVAANRYFPPETVLELAELAERLCAQNNDQLSVTAFRDLTGIGRNLTIDLFEFFDKVGFSRREGEHRRLLATAQQIFAVQTDQKA